MAQELAKDKDSVLFSNNGMLHCGGNIITAEELKDVKTPEPEGRWFPVDHALFEERAISCLTAGGHVVKKVERAISHEGKRYFGLLEMETSAENRGLTSSRIVGLRNSHDKTFRAQLVTGRGVFVCDNLSFCGEIEVGRKHTTNIERDLDILMGNAVGKLAEAFENTELRIEKYMDKEMSIEEVHHMICTGLKMGAIPSSKIKPVLNEYEKPRHEEFEPKNAWSFFNAFTEVGKAWPLDTLKNRTMRMHGILDDHVGLNLEPIIIDAETLEVETDKEADVVVTVG